MGIVPGLNIFPAVSDAAAPTARSAPPSAGSREGAERDCAIKTVLASTAKALLGAGTTSQCDIAGLIEDSARKLNGDGAVLVGWYDPASGLLEVPAGTRTGWPDPNLGPFEERGPSLTVRNPGGVVGRATAERRTVIVDGNSEKALAGSPPFDRMLAVPALGADGAPVGIVCVAGRTDGYTDRDQAAIADLTDLLRLALHRCRTETERALLARAVDQAPVSIVITDCAGIIRYVNRAFTDANGFSPDDVLGHNPRLLKSGYTAALEYERLWKTLAQGRTWRGEFHNRRKSGTLYWEQATVTPLRDPMGNIDAFVAIKDDITERKAQEIELIAAKEAAEDASRAKSTFLAHVSHELRTPLNAIIGFAEIMDRQLFGPVGDSHYRDYARYIGDSGRHLLALINDILDLSKVEAGRMEMVEAAVNVAAEVDITCTLLRGRAEAGRVLLDSTWLAPPPLLRADARMIRQILLNLVSNAVKFTPPEGRVTITGRRDAEGALIIDVTDTGPGISQADLATVLAPFGQLQHPVRPPESGSGLGLPLAKSLTELHGGTLSIASFKETGTTVTIRFPPVRVLTAGLNPGMQPGDK